MTEVLPRPKAAVGVVFADVGTRTLSVRLSEREDGYTRTLWADGWRALRDARENGWPPGGPPPVWADLPGNPRAAHGVPGDGGTLTFTIPTDRSHRLLPTRRQAGPHRDPDHGHRHPPHPDLPVPQPMRPRCPASTTPDRVQLRPGGMEGRSGGPRISAADHTGPAPGTVQASTDRNHGSGARFLGGERPPRCPCKISLPGEPGGLRAIGRRPRPIRHLPPHQGGTRHGQRVRVGAPKKPAFSVGAAWLAAWSAAGSCGEVWRGASG
jgi:hypothetical protein